MSASNVNSTGGPRQVTCATSDNNPVPVDLNLLRVSGTFKKMYDDLGLEEHDEFPGVFPVTTISTHTFKKVIDWCKEHKDEPEPVIEKDSLTQECKWLTLTDYDKTFFDVAVSELLELVMAASYLDIPRLYHYACQSIAARIKGKHPIEICEALFDLDDAQIRKARDDNPLLEWPGLFPGAPTENGISVPNEVLVRIFEKLPRKDLERLQVISTQFNDVIVSSFELSERQGPLHVVTKVEFGTFSCGLFSPKLNVWLRGGTVVTCTDYEDLAKRLKFATVQNLRLSAGYGGVSNADIEGLSALLPVKSAWANATLEASFQCPSKALFEFAFTQLFMCEEIVLCGDAQSFSWSRSYMHLPAIAACSKLDMSELTHCGIEPADVVEWLEHEDPQGKKSSEPKQMIIDQEAIGDDNTDELLTSLKTAFLASSRLSPYIVRIIESFHRDNLNEVLANEKTQERLSIRARQNYEIVVERA